MSGVDAKHVDIHVEHMNSPVMKVAVSNATINSSIEVPLSTVFPPLRHKVIAVSNSDRTSLVSMSVLPAAWATSTFVPGRPPDFDVEIFLPFLHLRELTDDFIVATNLY